MKLTFDNRVLSGSINPLPVEDEVKKNIIMASLCNKKSVINNVVINKHIFELIEAVELLGVKIKVTDYIFKRKTLTIEGKFPFDVKSDVISVNSDMDLLKKLIPLISVSSKQFSVKCKDISVNKPLDTFYDIFFEYGREGKSGEETENPLRIKGGTEENDFYIRGDVNRHYFESLLFTLPLLSHNSHIIIEGELKCKRELVNTIILLKQHGIKVKYSKDFQEFYIIGKQHYISTDITVENDYGMSSLWLCADALGHKIILKNLNIKSNQRNKRILDILKAIGSNVLVSDDGNVFIEAGNIDAFRLNISKYPDLLINLAMIASVAKGTSKFAHADEVLIDNKPIASDLAHMINSIGGNAILFNGDLVIEGREMLKGGHVENITEHRLIYALSIISRQCTGNITIELPENPPEYYREYYRDYVHLGGEINA